MSVGVASSRSQPQVHERLQRLLWSLRELEQRRLSQRVLVRSVLDLNPVLVLLKNPDPDCGRSHEEERPERKRGRSLDPELKSELQDLDRQILELRLDAAWSHAPPLSPESPAPDSRPSSGFFSDAASRSNSAFSLCSAFHTEATPTSPVTAPPAAEAPPPVSGVPRPPAPLQRSVSAPSSAPPLSPPPPAHLDKFISSLLQRRTLSSAQTRTFRPVLIQTSLSHRTGAPPTLATGRLTPPPGAPPTLATGRLTPPTLAAEGAAVSNGRKAAAILRSQTEEREFSCGESEEQRRRRRRSHRRRSRRKHLTHAVREGSPAQTERGGAERRRRRRRRRRRSAEEEQGTASLHSHKLRTRLGQSQSSRAMMSPEHSEGGGTEEETGSEGERTGRGGARRLQLVRIKASRNLKKRILRQKTATFTLMTTI